MAHLARLASILALVWCLVVFWGFWRPLSSPDSNSCRRVSMSPAYAKLHAFDASHTPLASKYSLYLYREQGRDKMPDPERHSFTLHGTPVLFIPGNAGSFKQVRSIASESTIQYYNDPSPFSNNLDFFTADFNEDFTAFHGRTMLDQAQYLNEAIRFILSLYQHNDNPPTSVILLGHSMGGIVARVMLSLPNYLSNSVNTILTLAAPHSAAPTTFDGDLLQVFMLTDDFWRMGLSANNNSKLSKIARDRLGDISIVSITGGHLDTTLPADYTSLDGLVPPRNGLTVSTTGIPGVWTPIDHLAIVWCDQLRHVLAKILLELVDKNSPSQTVSLENRMEIFKRHLLTNFDEEFEVSKEINDQSHLPYLLKFDYKQLTESSKQNPIQPAKKIIKRDESTPQMQVFYIPKDDLKFKFNFISSMKPVMINDFASYNISSSPSIMLCKTAAAEDSIDYDLVFDYTSKSTTQYIELECISVHDSIQTIPRSDSKVKSLADSSFKGKNSPFYSLEISPSVLSRYNTVVVVESLDRIDPNEFIVANMELDDICHEVLGSESLWSLIWQGADITLVPHSCSIVDIDVPVVRSGLFAYQLDVRYKKSKVEKFTPLIGQHVPGELKWHININDDSILNIIINGEAPYVPIPKDGKNNLKLKVFSDSTSEEIMDIYLSIDWLTTFSLVVLKYRLSIIGFPLFVTISCFILQLINWIQVGIFPSFDVALNKLCSGKLFLSLLFGFSIASPISSSKLLGPYISKLDPVSSPNWSLLPDNMEVNWNFLGIEEYNLWFYGPLLFCVSIVLNYIVHTLIVTAKDSAVVIVKILLRPGEQDSSVTKRGIKLSKLFVLPLTIVTFILSLIFLKLGFTVQGRIRRSIGVVVLTILVLLYLPYQFAYIVAFIAHAVGVLKLSVSNERSIESKEDNKDNETFKLNSLASKSQMNFNITLLLLLLWILPIQVPILIVWIHNLSLRWTTPFSSHHNVLAILPIILVVLACNRNTNIGIDQSSDKIKEKVKSQAPSSSINEWALQSILIGMLTYMAFYCVMFGTRHLFFIHGLFDIICVILLVCWVSGTLGGTMHTVGLMGYSRGWRNTPNEETSIKAR